MIKALVNILLITLCMPYYVANAQNETNVYKKLQPDVPSNETSVVKFGIASFYADKFQGCETYSGEFYHSEKLTAACNALPLNTWVKVTNLKNNKSVVVKINDKMAPKNKRLIDLSKAAARQLAFIFGGLTNVKVEVLKEMFVNP